MYLFKFKLQRTKQQPTAVILTHPCFFFFFPFLGVFAYVCEFTYMWYMCICVYRWEHLCLYRSLPYSLEIGDRPWGGLSYLACGASLEARKPHQSSVCMLTHGHHESHLGFIRGLGMELKSSCFHTQHSHSLNHFIHLSQPFLNTECSYFTNQSFTASWCSLYDPLTLILRRRQVWACSHIMLLPACLCPYYCGNNLHLLSPKYQLRVYLYHELNRENYLQNTVFVFPPHISIIIFSNIDNLWREIKVCRESRHSILWPQFSSVQ